MWVEIRKPPAPLFQAEIRVSTLEETNTTLSDQVGQYSLELDRFRQMLDIKLNIPCTTYDSLITVHDGVLYKLNTQMCLDVAGDESCTVR